MTIVSDNNYKKDVSLHAYAPCAQIIFEPFLNMGFVKVNQEKKEKLKFMNEGVKAAQINLNIDNADIQIQPKSFSINPNSEAEVTVIYKP